MMISLYTSLKSKPNIIYHINLVLTQTNEVTHIIYTFIEKHVLSNETDILLPMWLKRLSAIRVLQMVFRSVHYEIYSTMSLCIRQSAQTHVRRPLPALATERDKNWCVFITSHNNLYEYRRPNIRYLSIAHNQEKHGFVVLISM